MSVLFNLPEAQQTYILSQWLQAADIHQLDGAALGDRKFLRDLRNLIRSPTFVVPTYDFSEYRMSIIGWTIDRGLKFRSINLNSYTFEDDFVRAHFLRASGPVVEKIQVKMHADYEYNDYRGFDMGNQFSCIVKEIATFCPRLIEFSAYSKTPENKPRELFTDDKWDCVAQLLQACLCLEKLVLSQAHRLNETVLAAINSAPRLKELDISLSTIVARKAPLGTNTTVRVLHCTGVESVDKNGNEVSNEERACIFEMFPNLHSISITVPYDEGLQSVCTAWPLLRHANITTTASVDDAEVLLFAQSLPHLRSLHLRSQVDESCNPLAAVLLMENCPQLVHLNLCSEPRDDSLFILSRHSTREGEHPLRELYVDSMSEHTLCTVLALCPHLHTLGIVHAEPCSEDTIDDAYTIRTVHTPHTRPAELALHHINHSAIRALYLRNYTNLDDKHLEQLRTLEELHLSHIGWHLTQESILSLSMRCPALKALTVEFCSCVDYKFILPMLESCPALHTLRYVSHSGYNEYSYGGRDNTQSPANIMLSDMVRKFYPHIRCFKVDC